MRSKVAGARAPLAVSTSSGMISTRLQVCVSVDGVVSGHCTRSTPMFLARARPNSSRVQRPLKYVGVRSEEHTSELQSLMRISYAVFCLKKKTPQKHTPTHYTGNH